MDTFLIQSIDEWLLPIPADSPKDYILCVDIDYPEYLHDDHNCYPLAPEKLVVNKDILSPFVRVNFPDCQDSVEKLVPNLMVKKN